MKVFHVKSPLVVGFGNSLRSDDGIGRRAAAGFEAECSTCNVSVMSVHQLTPEQAEAVSLASCVLFLDAARAGVPGEIRCNRVRRDPALRPGTWTHHLSPQALLELAFRAFRAEPDAWLVTLTGANFDFGETFSVPVQGAWKSYLSRIKSLVNNL